MYHRRNFDFSSGSGGYACTKPALPECGIVRRCGTDFGSGGCGDVVGFVYDRDFICNGHADWSCFSVLQADPEAEAVYARFCKKGCGKEYAKGIVVGFIMFLAAVLICILTGAASFEKSDSFTVSMFLLFTAGYMVQGMAEEVLCRGYFMVSVGRRYPMAVAAVVNAVAFAALHLLNPGITPLAIVNLILFGIFASVCFIKTENIWMVGAIHSVWNLVQGNVYGIKVSGMETSCTVFSSVMTDGKELINGGAFGLEGGLAVTAALLAGIAVVYFSVRKQEV